MQAKKKNFSNLSSVKSMKITQILKSTGFASLSSAIMLSTAALIPSRTEAFIASDYKSAPSKKIIELNFDIAKVSKYIIAMVNTSNQPLACKMQAYYDIAVIDAQNTGKAVLQSALDTATGDSRKALENAAAQANEASFKVIDRELRILDSVCN